MDLVHNMAPFTRAHPSDILNYSRACSGGAVAHLKLTCSNARYILAALVAVWLMSACSASPPSSVIPYATSVRSAGDATSVAAATPSRRQTARVAIIASPTALRDVSSTPPSGPDPSETPTGVADKDQVNGVGPVGSPPAVILVGGTPAAEATVALAAGQVAEAVGLYATSNSHGERYYYAREDNGWRRIQPVHRAWFKGVDDLLRAFPNRILHQLANRQSTRTPTPSSAG